MFEKFYVGILTNEKYCLAVFSVFKKQIEN